MLYHLQLPIGLAKKFVWIFCTMLWKTQMKFLVNSIWCPPTILLKDNLSNNTLAFFFYQFTSCFQMCSFSCSLHSPVCMHTCSVVSDSVPPWTAAHQAPLSMRFFKQEYWSGLPSPPGDLPEPGIKPRPLLPLLHWQVDSLPLSHLGSPYIAPKKEILQELFFSYFTNEKAKA